MSALVKGIAGGGGNLNIVNGILQECYADSGEIEAGTFVEMVSDGFWSGFIELEPQIDYYGRIWTCILSTTEAGSLGVLHYKKSNVTFCCRGILINSDGYHLYDEYTYYTNSTTTYYASEIFPISDNKFIAFVSYYPNNYQNWYPIVGSIDSNGAITYGSFSASTRLSSNSIIKAYPFDSSHVLIVTHNTRTTSNNKVSLLYIDSNNNFTYKVVDQTLGNTGKPKNGFSLGNNKLFAVISGSFIFTLSDDGNSFTYQNIGYSTVKSMFGATKITDNKVIGFDAYTSNTVGFRILDVSGSAPVLLSTIEDSNLGPIADSSNQEYSVIIPLDNQEILLCNQKIVYKVKFNSNYTEIEKSYTPVTLNDLIVDSNFSNMFTKINNNKIFIMRFEAPYRQASGYIEPYKIGNCVKAATSSASMAGFTQDRVTTTTRGKTWVLNA